MSKNKVENNPSAVFSAEKMVNPLKLAIPSLDQHTLIRLRLVSEMNKGVAEKLTLISAPSGFGKTTLISQWAAQADQKYAYLLLDEFDNDPAVFFRHLIFCLQKINKNIGADAMEMLQSGSAPSMGAVLQRLVAQMGMVLSNYVIVLDDYQRIVAAPVHSMVAFLLEHLPPQAHLVICSEIDPPFNLSLLRANGLLKEIRAPYLTFTMDEAQALFKTVMQLQAPFGDITALVVRTQARAAALKYAALCLARYLDFSTFVAEFENDERDAEVFLAEILLKDQPEKIQRFVWQIAGLDWINPELATHVTAEKSSGKVLQTLSEAGEFVFALANGWFAIQPFVQPILMQPLLEKMPEKLPELHQRASRWHSKNGSIFSAMKHALTAEDYRLAAQYLETNAMQMLQNGFLVTVTHWMTALPESVIEARPMLSIISAWMNIISKDRNAIEPHLQNALKARENAPDPSEIDSQVKLIRDYLAER